MSGDTITWEVRSAEATLRYLDEMKPRMARNVHEAVERQTMLVLRRVLSKVGGSVLQMRSGGLARALQKGTYVVHEEARGRIVGVVGVRGATKEVAIQAGAQEYGASIAARILTAKAAAALKFTVDSKDVFAKRVQLPAIKLPARSFIRSTFAELKPSIQSAVNEAARIEAAPP